MTSEYFSTNSCIFKVLKGWKNLLDMQLFIADKFTVLISDKCIKTSSFCVNNFRLVAHLFKSC